MPAPAFPPAPRTRTRVLMAVHSAERGGAQLVALGQARALRHECDLVIAVSAGPLRGAFADVATAIVHGPTSLPIWGASYGRWALQIGRSIPDAVPGRTWPLWRPATTSQVPGSNRCWASSVCPM